MGKGIAIVLILLVFVLVGGFFLLNSNNFSSNENSQQGIAVGEPNPSSQGDDGVVCTMEVKACQDGSEVGRNPDNNCEFFECSSSSDVKEFNIIAKKWEFEPSTITVNEGDTVVLNVESVDVDHGIALLVFNVNEDLSPGETVRIEFVADKKGTFEFFCNVYCGSGHSEMEGTLIVQ